MKFNFTKSIFFLVSILLSIMGILEGFFDVSELFERLWDVRESEGGERECVALWYGSLREP